MTRKRRELYLEVGGLGLTLQSLPMMLWPLTWRNLGSERTAWSPNVPAKAILNAKKCQSWNNHSAIVLSLFTEVSVIALHSNSIFKVHCARKMLQLLNSYFLIQAGWEVRSFELYENPHETFQQHGRALFQHPAHSLFLEPGESSHPQGLSSFWQQTLKEHQWEQRQKKRTTQGCWGLILLSQEDQDSPGAMGWVLVPLPCNVGPLALQWTLASTTSVQKVNFYRLPHWDPLASGCWLSPANRRMEKLGQSFSPCFFVVWAVATLLYSRVSLSQFCWHLGLTNSLW